MKLVLGEDRCQYLNKNENFVLDPVYVTYTRVNVSKCRTQIFFDSSAYNWHKMNRPMSMPMSEMSGRQGYMDEIVVSG